MLAQFWRDFHQTVEQTMEIRNTQILDTMNEVLGAHIFAIPAKATRANARNGRRAIEP